MFPVLPGLDGHHVVYQQFLATVMRVHSAIYSDNQGHPGRLCQPTIKITVNLKNNLVQNTYNHENLVDSVSLVAGYLPIRRICLQKILIIIATLVSSI